MEGLSAHIDGEMQRMCSINSSWGSPNRHMPHYQFPFNFPKKITKIQSPPYWSKYQ